ncbi:MAG TPA: glycine zipper 2TM domain-containing protein [Sphingomicrobium sp.]|nr:glycine zipper 2TM domain-containing protein [Sphingomicrobium sp.]
MKRMILAAAALGVASPIAFAAPAEAQSRNYNRELRECNRELRRADTRAEYRQELRECRRELRRAQNQDWRRYSRYDYNRYEPGYNRYYADRYYRDGSYYPDRRLTRNDRIYRGQNGQYYCRRSDGTTGLIVGGAVGALIGREIDRGGSRTVGTILGAGAGALLGREIARGGLRCN